MANITSLYARLSSALSGLSNALFGQTRANARLNAMSVMISPMNYSRYADLYDFLVRHATLIIRYSAPACWQM